ncbi:hypothetical protein Tco_0700072 [Tanacetum coccineum]
MLTYLKNMEGWKCKDLKSKDFDSIKELFDKASKRVNMFVDYRTDLVEGSSKGAGDELEQEVTKKQKVDDVQETAEVDDVQEAAKIKEFMEIVPDEEEVAIDAIPLATKPPTIVDSKIHKEGKKNYYQIIRADGSSKMYLVFSHMFKSFDRGDFETLVLDWKLYDSCGVHSLRMQHMHIHMLVEKRYPLTPATITDMLNKKLQFNAAEVVNAASEEVSTAELVSTAYVTVELFGVLLPLLISRPILLFTIIMANPPPLNHAANLSEDEPVHPEPAPLVPDHAPTQPEGYLSDDDIEEDLEEQPEPEPEPAFAPFAQAAQDNMNGWLE